MMHLFVVIQIYMDKIAKYISDDEWFRGTLTAKYMYYDLLLQVYSAWRRAPLLLLLLVKQTFFSGKKMRPEACSIWHSGVR